MQKILICELFNDVGFKLQVLPRMEGLSVYITLKCIHNHCAVHQGRQDLEN
jgi:hypothetical protein